MGCVFFPSILLMTSYKTFTDFHSKLPDVNSTKSRQNLAEKVFLECLSTDQVELSSYAWNVIPLQQKCHV